MILVRGGSVQTAVYPVIISSMVLEILDWLFHLIHLTAIVVNLTFWLSLRTLRLAQFTQILTLSSWFGFGMVYGFGYCFLTDWHWKLKERMGDTDLPLSYVKLVLDRTTGFNWDPETVDQATLIALFISVTGCAVQSVRSYSRSGLRRKR